MLATIQITEKCNFNCSYCFEGEKGNRSMSFDLGKKCIDYVINTFQQLKEPDEKLYITLYGGEPLLEFELFKNIFFYAEKTAREYDIDISFSTITNGYLINQEIMDFFNEYRDKFSLKISLDGKKAIHDSHRVTYDGKGTFDIVFNNARTMLEVIDKIQIASVVTPGNETGLYENLVFLAEEGFNYLEFDINQFDPMWTPEHFANLREQIAKIGNYYLEKLEVNEEFKIKTLDNWIMTLVADVNDLFRCGAGVKNFYINVEGDFYSCPLGDNMPECYFGNLREGFNENVDIIKELTFEDFNEECHNCNYRYKCALTCIARNIRGSGCISTISPLYCANNKLSIEMGRDLGNLLYEKRPDIFKKRFLDKLNNSRR